MYATLRHCEPHPTRTCVFVPLFLLSLLHSNLPFPAIFAIFPCSYPCKIFIHTLLYFVTIASKKKKTVQKSHNSVLQNITTSMLSLSSIVLLFFLFLQLSIARKLVRSSPSRHQNKIITVLRLSLRKFH